MDPEGHKVEVWSLRDARAVADEAAAEARQAREHHSDEDDQHTQHSKQGKHGKHGKEEKPLKMVGLRRVSNVGVMAMMLAKAADAQAKMDLVLPVFDSSSNRKNPTQAQKGVAGANGKKRGQGGAIVRAEIFSVAKEYGICWDTAPMIDARTLASGLNRDTTAPH